MKSHPTVVKQKCRHQSCSLERYELIKSPFRWNYHYRKGNLKKQLAIWK